MNKFLTWLPAVMVLGTVTYKHVKEATQPKLVNKDISFAVYKGSSYATAAYNSTSAQVHMIVEKVNTNGQHIIVWDKTLDSRYLSKYPSVENALKEDITIHNVNQKKEYLVLLYTLTYNSKGSQLQMHEGTIVNDRDSGRLTLAFNRISFIRAEQ